MFGMDFEALVLLAVLAFILFGPEKLPEYAAKAGYYLAKLRQATTELTQQAQCSFHNLQRRRPTGVAPQHGRPPSRAYERPAPCAQLVSRLHCP